MPEERDDGYNGRALDLHGAEVQEILGYIPHGIIRWGITVVAIILGLLVVGSWFYKYPDVIASMVEIATPRPPARIVARAGGKITHLFVSDKDFVEAGQSLAVVESTTKYWDVLTVKRLILVFKETFEMSRTQVFDEDFSFGRQYRLGELQVHYEAFLKGLSDYRQFIKLEYHPKKIRFMKEQLKNYRRYSEQLDKQKAILEEELRLNGQEKARIKELWIKKTVSKSEVERAEAAHLQKRHAVEGAEIQATNVQIQINESRQALLELELDYESRQNQIETEVMRSYESLISAVLEWEQRFVLVSPIQGKVSFAKFWSVNQNITPGDNVMAVVPETAGEIVGRIKLPVAGAGKVKKGQRVNLKFLSYPHMEFGMVFGIVEAKSLISEDNGYIVTIGFPNGLTTNYGIRLPFEQNMMGSAEIITDDIRLFDRMLNPVRSLLKRNTGPSKMQNWE